MPTISFQPATYNVKWDGLSEAKLAVELACADTAATYTGIAYPVMTSSGEYVSANTNFTNVLTWKKGDRAFAISDTGSSNPTKSFGGEITIPVTVSSSVATILFSGAIPEYTARAYSWRLEAVKSGTKKVFVAGRVDVDGIPPYSQTTPSTTFVSGATASGCF